MYKKIELYKQYSGNKNVVVPEGVRSPAVDGHYLYINDEVLTRQLLVINCTRHTDALLVKDEKGNYKLYTVPSKDYPFYQDESTVANFIEWYEISKLTYVMLEYLKNTLKDISCLIDKEGLPGTFTPKHDNMYNVSWTVTVHNDDTDKTEEVLNGILGIGAIMNTDGEIRELKATRVTSGVNDIDRFVYKLILTIDANELLTCSRIYDVSMFLKDYLMFSEIPPFKSNPKEIQYEY